jgi:hypothetical protein
VVIEDTWRGFRGVPTFGLASGRGASIETNRVRISLTEGGFGAIHDGGAVRHAGIQADTNDAGAIIAQRTDSFEVMGGSELADNQFAGLMLVEATGVLVQDTMIRGTISVSRTTGSWGTIDVGDGLLVVAPREGSRFERLDLIGNGRAGMLFDLMGTETSLFTITGVTVGAEGSGYGCVAQNGNLIEGWDTGVVRTGSAMANDVGFTGGLDIISPLKPADLPPTELLVGVIGPCN